MKKAHISAIYEAKRTIVRNKSKIIALIKAQDAENIKKLREENEAIRKRILLRYGIILDD